jgi:hypothetical protein
VNKLVPLYRDMAKGGLYFRGLSILQHKSQIAEIIREHDARSLLDYGCGAGDAYHAPHEVWKAWGISKLKIRLYDPAFPHWRHTITERYDGVLCSDVLEHVPEDEVDETVRTLFRHARKFVWASVCSRPAGKTFPDGTNLHVTQKPLQWWEDTFREHADGKPFYLMETP